MADRSIGVRYSVDTGDATSKLRGLADANRNVSKSAKDAGQGLDTVGHASTKNVGVLRTVTGATGELRHSFDRLGLGMGLAGAAVGVGLAKAVTAAMDFDREMSAVASVAGATVMEMEELRRAALDAGAATAFSAGQSAEAITELSRAGVSTADVLDGALTGSLDLAAAGGLGLADAATVAAQALNVFDLSGGEATRVADTLAAGANKSAADVKSLGDALRQGGLLAAQTGLSLEETVGALSLFADNALVGSDAGTSLSAVLRTLNPQSKEAAELMEQLGFSAYDASGSFIGLEQLAAELQESFGGLTTEQRNAAMMTIFGADAVRSANILMGAGAEGVQEYVTAVSDQGAAAEMAGTMLNNLKGDVEELKGSVETAKIAFGEHAGGILRSAAQMATGVVNALGELPDSTQKAVTGIGAVGAGLGLAGGAFLTFAPKVAEAQGTMAQFGGAKGILASTARFLMGPWGLAIAAGAGALISFAQNTAEAQRISEEFGAILEENQGLLRDGQPSDADMAQQYIDAQVAASGLEGTVLRLGLSTQELFDYVNAQESFGDRLNLDQFDIRNILSEGTMGLVDPTEERQLYEMLHRLRDEMGEQIRLRNTNAATIAAENIAIGDQATAMVYFESTGLTTLQAVEAAQIAVSNAMHQAAVDAELMGVALSGTAAGDILHETALELQAASSGTLTFAQALRIAGDEAGYTSTGYMTIAEAAAASSAAMWEGTRAQDASMGAAIAHAGMLDRVAESYQAGSAGLGTWREAIAGVGVNTMGVLPQLDELQVRLQRLDDFDGGVDNFGAYTQMLADLNASRREWAEGEAADTEDAADSWETFFTEVTVDADLYLQAQQDQIVRQQEWGALMAEAQARGLERIAAEIYAAGPDMNELYQDLFYDSPVEAAQEAESALADQARLNVENAAIAVNTAGVDFVDSYGQIGGAAVERIADMLGLTDDQVAAALHGSALVAAELEYLVVDAFGAAGQHAVEAMNGKLAAGVLTAAEISLAYQDALILGINPLIVALGQPSIERASARAAGISMPSGLNAGGAVPGPGDERSTLTIGTYMETLA